MAIRRSTQTASQKYQSIRRVGAATTSQSSYASTLAKRQAAAEDDYYDNAYSNGGITAEQYITNLNARLARTYNTPLQKQNLQQKVTSVQQDYQDQLVETAYRTGQTYNGNVVDTQFMLDKAQKKLDAMTPGSEAYAKQQTVLQTYKDKLQAEADRKTLDTRKAYRQQELLKLSNMRETSSVELQNKANMYTQLEAMARADGETTEADNYLIQKNNLQQAADRAGVTERIQDVNLANSQPVSPMPANPTTGQVSDTEQMFANGNVPATDNQSVVNYYVNQAKAQGITDPTQIKQYIDNQGLSIDVGLPQIQQGLTAGQSIPTITPEIVNYAGIDLDKKVYDRIKASKEVQSYLSNNAKLINQIQGEKGKNNGLVNQIASQMNLVNVLKKELDNAKPDNKDSILRSYNDAVEKYNGLVQRKDDLMTKLQDQQTGFSEVISKKASSVMKEQDAQFEDDLKKQVKETQKNFQSGKLSKEEYVATLHGVAGTPMEQAYKQNLLNALQKKGVKVPAGASFEDIAKVAVSNNIRTEAEITKELYGLYGVGQQMYSLRGSLYDNIGDIATKQKIGDLEGEYSVNRRRIADNVVPNLANLRVMQNDEGNDNTVNLTTMGYGVKKGEYTLIDPTADAAKQGISPQDAIKDWENHHTQVGGVWYPIRVDTNTSKFRTPEAKKAFGEQANNYYFKKIDPNTGKETMVQVKGVDYGDGATRFIPTAEMDKLLKSNYVVQKGDKLVRNYNSGNINMTTEFLKNMGQSAIEKGGKLIKDAAYWMQPFVTDPNDPRNQPVMPFKKTDNKNQSNPLSGFMDTAGKALSFLNPVKPVIAADTPNLRVQPTSQQNFEALVKPIAQKYGIPMAVIMGQYAAEGRDKGLGASRNNFFNIGGFDGQEGQMPSYKTAQEGIEAYARLLATDPRYAKAYALRNNPTAMIKAIETAGYAGDPTTYAQRASNNFPSYSSFVMATPEFKKHAVAVPTVTPTPTTVKPKAVVSTSAPKSAGANSFIKNAVEAVSNFIAPPVSGAAPSGSQSQSRPSNSGGGGGSSQQSIPQVKVTPQAQAAVQKMNQSPVIKALEQPKVSQPSASLNFKPPTPAPSKPNVVQNVVNTVKNAVKNVGSWISSWWR